jgi:hypothetical protein
VPLHFALELTVLPVIVLLLPGSLTLPVKIQKSAITNGQEQAQRFKMEGRKRDTGSALSRGLSLLLPLLLLPDLAPARKLVDKRTVQVRAQ